MWGGSNSPSGPPPVPANGATVNATPSLTFAPDTVTVNAGETVTFAFASVDHNVFFDRQAGAPADIPGDNDSVSVSRVFSTAGAYRYTCHIHPFMHGTVVVR
jgi:plastocyanin